MVNKKEQIGELIY